MCAFGITLKPGPCKHAAMDVSDLDMTQVIHQPDDSEDDVGREVRAVLKLHDQDAPAPFQSFNLKPGCNVVGRSRSCDVIIENFAVSKQHAVIDVGADSCTIKDLGSQNKVKIGKRILKPHCVYNLDYNEEFTIAGLRARVLCDQKNGANSDTGSDTCSESLLTAIEVALDQQGVDVKAFATCDNGTTPEVPARASGCDQAPETAVASNLDVSNDDTAVKSLPNAKAHSSEHQSSGSFNLPEMPSLDYTQTESSQGTELYTGPDHEPRRSQEGTGTALPAAQVPEGNSAPAEKDTEAKMQPYSSATGGENAGDTLQPAATDEERCLNVEAKSYASNSECPKVPSLSHGEGVDVEMDETDRLNAPTQAYRDDISAESERLNAPTQAYTEQDDVECLDAVMEPDAVDVGANEDERLNAVTQPYTADVSMDEEERLNAVTQPYTAGVNQDEEEERLNAETQAYPANVDQGEEARLNAAAQPYAAAEVNQDEHEKLNDVTCSFSDDREEDGDMGEDSVCAPTQQEGKHRRLLSGPSELSFVLCEATQPSRDDGGDDDDDEFCAPTQKDESPPLKVHALLKCRRERGPAAGEDDNDKTPPLSPKTTVDETPPPSPGIVPESDPEDDGDTSMVTARRSPSLLNTSDMTVYEDCVTPGSGMSSPVLGKTSSRPQRRGMSLKKPTCDTVIELPSQESAAGAEWMQQQEASSQSKASRKLTYITEADEDKCIDSGAADTSPKPLASGGEPNKQNITTCTPPKVLLEPQESTDAYKKSASAEYSEMPLLHMSEDMDFDTTGTDKEDCTAGDTAVAEGEEPAEPCTSSAKLADVNEPSGNEAMPGGGSREEAALKDKLDDAPLKNKENSCNVSGRKGKEEVSGDAGTLPEQACEEEQPHEKDEQPLENDEPANVPSESEEENGRVTRRKGRKQPPARATRGKKKEAKNAPIENTAAPARRSSGRQNAGSRMKSFLSLEKRTSASGDLKESELSQEVADKKNTHEDDTPMEEAHGKAGRPRTRRGAKGKAAAKDEPEVVPPPSEGPTSAKEPEVASNLNGAENKETSVKSREDDLEGEAEVGDSTVADHTKGCLSKAGPSVHEEGGNAEDALSTGSLTPSLGDGDANCTNATIDTCFSEPFPTFSEVMAECQPYIEDNKGEDEKNEAIKDEKTTAELAAEGEPKASAMSEPVPTVEEPPQSSRSKDAKEGVATRNRKASKVADQLPSTSHQATRRGARKKPPVEAEAPVEDALSSVEQPVAPQSATSQHSNKARRGRPFRGALGREAVPTIVVTKIIEDVEESEESEPDLAEDHASSVRQPKAMQLAPRQQSNRARRGRPFRSAVGRNAGKPSVMVTETIEDSEQSECEPDPDRLSAQDTESIDGTLSEASEGLTPSRGKAIPQPEVSKVSRRGARSTKRLLQLGAKQAAEETASEPDVDRLSAQDTESIHGTPSNTTAKLTPSEGKAVPSLSLRGASQRDARNTRLSLRQDAEQADEAASEGPAAENSEGPAQDARPSPSGRASTKNRSVRKEEASNLPEAHVSLERVELSQSPQTSQRGKRGVKQPQEEDEPPIQSSLDDSTQSLSTEPRSQSSQTSRQGRRNVKQPETRDVFIPKETGDAPPIQSALDDSTQSLSTDSQSRSSRSSRLGRQNGKQSKARDKLNPEETEDVPPVQSALNDSTQSLSSESQSQTSRRARLGRRNVEGPDALESLTPEETGDLEAQDAKPSRRGRKVPKLSQEAGGSAVAGAGKNSLTPASTEHEPETRRARRRGDSAEQSSQSKQIRLTPEAAEAEPREHATSTEVEPQSPQTRRGRKAARPARKLRASKNSPEEDVARETLEKVKPPESKSLKPPRATNLSLPQPAAATCLTEVPVEVEPPSPRMSQRSSTRTTKAQCEETELVNDGDSAKVSSKSKHKVTKLKPEDVAVEETKAPRMPSSSRMPALDAHVPVTRKRDARRNSRKDNPSPTTTLPVLKALEAGSPQCPVRRVGRKRHVASMSFGEPRHESDSEATDNEQETLDEVVVNIGSKSRRKVPAKEVVVKQELEQKAPARRGKRKADLSESEPQVSQKATSRQDEQVDSLPTPKKATKVKPKILFTGIEDTTKEQQVVRDLGGTIATSAPVCTHLVVDKFKRTVKALCCIGKGTPIVDIAWIKKCQEAGTFVDHAPFMLLDRKAEKALNFSLRDTLAKALQGGVLRGWSVHSTPHVLPSPSDMKEIVLCAGGKYLDNMPVRTSTCTTVVVSCKQDLKACARARSSGIPVVTAEFILSGLLQHRLDVDTHRLE